MEKLHIHITRIAAVLLCLTLFSCYLLCGMYAKYTSQGSGSDSARVAKFRVSESNDLQSYSYAVEIDPDTTETLSVQITNDSETSVKYILSFVVEGNLPLTITPDTGYGEGNTLHEEAENVWTAEKSANLNTTETFRFHLQLSERGYMYSGGTEMITLTLAAEQVD